MRSVSDANLAAEARGWRWLINLAVLLIGLDLLFEIGAPLFLPLSAGVYGGYWGLLLDQAPEIGRRLVEVLPAIFYLGALLAAGDLLTEAAGRRPFTARAVQSLGRIGSGLLWGAAAASLITPNLLLWIAREGGFDFRLETETLVIAAIGATMMVIGYLLRGAGRLQSELDEIV
jgi:hypothetical protein